VGWNFCLEKDKESGYCCSPREVLAGECPRADYCSDDNHRAPTIYKYFSCPNEEVCGSRKIIPSLDGEVITRSQDKYAENY
jgi:hypothetical protein